jgi:hypothetical protein
VSAVTEVLYPVGGADHGKRMIELAQRVGAAFTGTLMPEPNPSLTTISI